MTQNNLKVALSFVSTALGLVLGAHASGTIKLPVGTVGWLGVAASAIGIFGASPIGRVVGRKETRDVGPTFPEDEDLTPAETPSAKERRS